MLQNAYKLQSSFYVLSSVSDAGKNLQWMKHFHLMLGFLNNSYNGAGLSCGPQMNHWWEACQVSCCPEKANEMYQHLQHPSAEHISFYPRVLLEKSSGGHICWPVWLLQLHWCSFGVNHTRYKEDAEHSYMFCILILHHYFADSASLFCNRNVAIVAWIPNVILWSQNPQCHNISTKEKYLKKKFNLSSYLMKSIQSCSVNKW